MKTVIDSLCRVCTLGLIATVAADKPELRTIDNAIKTDPVRIAPCVRIDGQVVRTGPWHAYVSDVRGPACEHTLVYDCFDMDEAGWPINGDVRCGLSPSSRWYWGPSYYNPYSINDYTVEAGAGMHVSRYAFAWYQIFSGNFMLAFFSKDDFDASCVGPGSSGSLGGVMIDFGFLNTSVGAGYFFTHTELCGTGIDVGIAADGSGATDTFHLTYDSADPNTLLLAPSQLMLWGADFEVNDIPGSQGPIQWDDDAPPSTSFPPGPHTAPDECRDYSGLVACPDPLGNTIAFWVEGTPCEADADGDMDTDFDDFSILVSQWLTAGPDADFNGDEVVDFLDFTIMVDEWNCSL